MTVKEVFSKAFGEVPEGATCHIQYYSRTRDYGWGEISPCYELEGKLYTRYGDKWSLERCDTGESKWADGPDVSDRDASFMRGFFCGGHGKAYDEVLDCPDATKSPSD